MLLPCWKINGAKTNTTNAQRKNAISKICTSFDKYLTALCIITKNKPDIIMKHIAINGFGMLLVKFLIFLIEGKGKPKCLKNFFPYNLFI